jgi:hypothetical protein
MGRLGSCLRLDEGIRRSGTGLKDREDFVQRYSGWQSPFRLRRYFNDLHSSVWRFGCGFTYFCCSYFPFERSSVVRVSWIVCMALGGSSCLFLYLGGVFAKPLFVYPAVSEIPYEDCSNVHTVRSIISCPLSVQTSREQFLSGEQEVHVATAKHCCSWQRDFYCEGANSRDML